jgi:hypothetical protein
MGIRIGNEIYHKGLVVSTGRDYHTSMDMYIDYAYVYNPASEFVEKIFYVFTPEGERLDFVFHDVTVDIQEGEFYQALQHRVYHAVYEGYIQGQQKDFECPYLEKGVRVQFTSDYKPRKGDYAGELIKAGTFARVFYMGYNKYGETVGIGLEGAELDERGFFVKSIFCPVEKIVTVPEKDSVFVPDVESAREAAINAANNIARHTAFIMR